MKGFRTRYSFVTITRTARDSVSFRQTITSRMMKMKHMVWNTKAGMPGFTMKSCLSTDIVTWSTIQLQPQEACMRFPPQHQLAQETTTSLCQAQNARYRLRRIPRLSRRKLNRTYESQILYQEEHRVYDNSEIARFRLEVLHR